MELSMEKLTDIDYLIGLLAPSGLKLLGALAIFFIGKWIAGRIRAVSEKMMGRSGMDVTLAGFLGNIIYSLVLVFAVLAALGQLGINTTSAVAIVAGASLAVGMALKDQLSSFAAGAMIIMFRPFRVGDFIEAGGTMGTVEEINIVQTQLKTPNNQKVIVPNAEIWAGSIINYSINPTRRIDLTVGVSYDADLRQARHVIEKVVADMGEVILEDPAPSIVVKELADSSVNFAVRPWVNTSDYWGTLCELTERLKLALDDAGIGIPYPQMDIHMSPTDKQQEAA